MGRGHPDANVVSILSSIWLLPLIAVGWLARRAHSSACARLHQIEFPPPLPARVYESRCASIHLDELVHDCHHYRVDDRILLHITLPLRNRFQGVLDQLYYRVGRLSPNEARSSGLCDLGRYYGRVDDSAPDSGSIAGYPPNASVDG